jgi:hypothetical protein
MTTPKDYDTDPSTPSSKRQSEPRTAAAAVCLEDPSSPTDDASPEGDPFPIEVVADGSPPVSSKAVGRTQRLGLVRSKPTTDPGIAPPPQPLPPLRQPLGIVVPPVARQPTDSVDVLLDGMSTEGPGRVPTTSQTDGQPKAMYHSEHAVRAARRALGDEPKVVIERRLLAQTVRVQRSPAASLEMDSKAWADTTSVRVKPLAGRVAIAIFAGMVVVMLVFGALERMSGERAGNTAGTPMALSAAAPALATAAPAPENATLAPAPPETAMTPTTALADSHPSMTPLGAASSATRKPSPAGKLSKPKPKPAASGMKPAGDDLGEFKSAL